MSYRVYEISSSAGYDGIAIVAADNAEAANVIIKNFKDDDPQNREDSLGFKFVTELVGRKITAFRRCYECHLHSSLQR